MTIQTPIQTAPAILSLFRGLSDYDRHRALQLLIAEFPYGEREADLFLASAASELHPHREDLQDSLYPFGFLGAAAARRHRMDLESAVLTAERHAAGRAAMMCARESLSGAAFHNGSFGG